MAYILEGKSNKYVGASTDTKPTVSGGAPVPVGSEFSESDTRDKSVFTGTEWKKKKGTNRSRTSAEERR